MVALLNKCYFFVFIFILCNCKINSVGRKKTKSNSERNINKFVKSNGSDVIADFYENNDTKSSLEKVNNIPIWNNKNTNEHFIGGIVELAKDDLNSTKSSFGTMYKNIFTNYESVEKVIVGIHDYIQQKGNYPGDVLKAVNGYFEAVNTSVVSVLKECENNLNNKDDFLSVQYGNKIIFLIVVNLNINKSASQNKNLENVIIDENYLVS